MLILLIYDLGTSSFSPAQIQNYYTMLYVAFCNKSPKRPPTQASTSSRMPLLSLLHRWYISRLSIHYQYFHDISSGKWHSLVPPAPTFTVKTWHITYTESIPPHFLHNPLVRSKFYSNSFFLRIVAMWNGYGLAMKCYKKEEILP